MKVSHYFTVEYTVYFIEKGKTRLRRKKFKWEKDALKFINTNVGKWEPFYKLENKRNAVFSKDE